jgi:hypothetical protein
MLEFGLGEELFLLLFWFSITLPILDHLVASLVMVMVGAATGAGM